MRLFAFAALYFFTLIASAQQSNAGLEKDYYKAIDLYQAKQYNDALLLFKKVRSANIAVMSASSAFYEGVIQYGLENYGGAKSAFEWVIDNSKDPELDKKADEYLEAVFQAIRVQKEMQKKWKIVASLGLNYDSNILFSPDNDSASAVVEDEGGTRALLQGEVGRKLSRSAESDLSAKLSSLYMYSSDSAFSRADPWLTSFGLPYNVRSETVGKTAFQYSFEPSGEILYMDANDDGTREKILSSLVLDNNVTFIKREDYLASYGLQLRIDESDLEISSDEDNSDALKYRVNTTHTLFLDKTQKRAFIGKAIYVANAAKGKNKNFNRITVGATYVSPAKKWQNTTWTLGLSAYKLTYPEDDEGRRDTNMTLDYSLTKVKNESWAYTGVASYSSNTSSVADNQYTRYSLMAMATYTWAQ